MMNGIIIVYKEQKFTSFDVVAKLRGILKQKKIGHTGTLDPDAVGVLPVCLGSATKLCDMLKDRTKEYIADFILGKTTDTQDISGTVLTESPIQCTEEEVRSTILRFLGEQDQIPPMYSALKVNGKRLYELAREGREIERKARKITIYDLEVLEIDLPVVKIRVQCSKGTYIRTLCHDIGEKLGCGATMTALERTRSGEFTKDMALTLDQIEKLRDEGCIEQHVIPVDRAFAEYPQLVIQGALLQKVMNGNVIPIQALQELCSGEERERILAGEPVRIYMEETGRQTFLAVYEYVAEKGGIRPLKMFLPQEG